MCLQIDVIFSQRNWQIIIEIKCEIKRHLGSTRARLCTALSIHLQSNTVVPLLRLESSARCRLHVGEKNNISSFFRFKNVDIWLSASVTWAKADRCFRYMWTSSSFPSGRGLFWHQDQTVCRCSIFLQSQMCRHGSFRGRHILRGFGFATAIQLLINLFQNKEYLLWLDL